jgi:hypothetical protein
MGLVAFIQAVVSTQQTPVDTSNWVMYDDGTSMLYDDGSNMEYDQ